MLGGRDQPDRAETATSGSATTPVGQRHVTHVESFHDGVHHDARPVPWTRV